MILCSYAGVRLGARSMMWLLATDMQLWKDHFEEASTTEHGLFLLISNVHNLYFILKLKAQLK